MNTILSCIGSLMFENQRERFQAVMVINSLAKVWEWMKPTASYAASLSKIYGAASDAKFVSCLRC